ncbi:unnamed protein product [Periconia digitata]|uniref:Uncharacterized protein n=1 Tax=Periconia digitata TaxID=1303443 RepID=A0A9W4XZA7_9PLEO|nr:unnamed protein product [Periconia digitata]
MDSPLGPFTSMVKDVGECGHNTLNIPLNICAIIGFMNANGSLQIHAVSTLFLVLESTRSFGKGTNQAVLSSVAVP